VFFIKKIEDFSVLYILTIAKISAGSSRSATTKVRAGIITALSTTACVKKLREGFVVTHITRAVRTETHTHRAVAVKSSIHNYQFLFFFNNTKVGSSVFAVTL
jgi:hypothetical protein